MWRGQGRAEITLRITIQEYPKATVLRLDGRVVGDWVPELDRAWRSLAASLGPKKLLVDLRGVTYADQDGRHVLADIHKATGAAFKADTPMTEYFAAEAQGREKDNEEVA